MKVLGRRIGGSNKQYEDYQTEFTDEEGYITLYIQVQVAVTYLASIIRKSLIKNP